MTTKDVATKLVDYVRQGKIFEAQTELYADDITYIEPESAMAPHIIKEKAAVADRGKQFAAMIEERESSTCSDAVTGANYFSISLSLDATMKGIGRQILDEVCV